MIVIEPMRVSVSDGTSRAETYEAKTKTRQPRHSLQHSTRRLWWIGRESVNPATARSALHCDSVAAGATAHARKFCAISDLCAAVPGDGRNGESYDQRTVRHHGGS